MTSRSLLAPRVVLTRAAKVDGAPTVASRWLLRLQALVDGMGLSLEPSSPGWPGRSSVPRSPRPAGARARAASARQREAAHAKRYGHREMDCQSLRHLRAQHPGPRTAAPARRTPGAVAAGPGHSRCPRPVRPAVSEQASARRCAPADGSRAGGARGLPRQSAHRGFLGAALRALCGMVRRDGGRRGAAGITRTHRR